MQQLEHKLIKTIYIGFRKKRPFVAGKSTKLIAVFIIARFGSIYVFNYQKRSIYLYT